MPDRNGSNEPRDAKDARAGDKPKSGGFGAFAEVYRARWAASHPEMNRTWPTDGVAEPAAPPSTTDADQAPGAGPDETPRPATGEGEGEGER